MKPLPRLLLALALACAPLTTPAQDAAALKDLVTLLKDAPLEDVVKKAIAKELKDPDRLNGLLDSLRARSTDSAGNIHGLAGVLSNLNVRFKAFEAKNGGDSSLGIEYSYERSLKEHELDRRVGHPMSLSFTVHAKGNIAFDPKRNPDDFLDTGASFDVFGSKGGFAPVADAAEWQAHVQELISTASQFTGTAEELDASPVWREIESQVGSRLRTQYFWRASGNFSYESNQDFTKRQYAYGFLASAVVRAWNPESAWTEFNVFDWPFAGLRYLTGADATFSPSGRALPVVVVGLEQVDPAKNTDRLAVDPDDSTFARWRGELSMKTKVARVGGQDVWAYGSYRLFREISPSTAIRAAGLANFEYWAVGLEMTNGLGITYSKGKLPLDRKSDQVFEIGYKFNFQ